MQKIYFPILLLFGLSACTMQLKPRKPITGLPPSQYVAVINLSDSRPDLRTAQFLFDVKTVDRGRSLDCQYEDVVEAARRKSAPFGANFMVITERKLPEAERSNCNRIQAKLYHLPDLGGFEALIFWDKARPLQEADLRGQGNAVLPPIRCSIKHRLMGNFFSTMTVRTITQFSADSTSLPVGKYRNIALRRAQLQFDLAELEARKIKQSIKAMAPNVTAIAKASKPMERAAQKAWQDIASQMDTELLASNDPETVLSRWETKVKKDMRDWDEFRPDVVIDLRKKSKRNTDEPGSAIGQ
ncbi:MAG: hypothetical protein IPL65_18295 [Lewinellaceae bacterium]|nr:hypothetical protein [Lewinellaceae bacterium]